MSTISRAYPRATRYNPRQPQFIQPKVTTPPTPDLTGFLAFFR
jgi:hypothetical protein